MGSMSSTVGLSLWRPTVSLEAYIWRPVAVSLLLHTYVPYRNAVLPYLHNRQVAIITEVKKMMKIVVINRLCNTVLRKYTAS